MATLRPDIERSCIVIESLDGPLFKSLNGFPVYGYDIECVEFGLFDLWIAPHLDNPYLSMRRRRVAFELKGDFYVSVAWGDCTYSSNDSVIFEDKPFLETVDLVEFAIMENSSGGFFHGLSGIGEDGVYSYASPAILASLHHYYTLSGKFPDFSMD
jgi:hypothetical protein